MTLQYKLDENDLLQHHLFVASKSERIKKQRIKTWLILSGLILLLALLFYQKFGMDLQTGYFLTTGFLCLFFYPFYQKWSYKNYYQKFVNDTKKPLIDRTLHISFADDHIKTANTNTESRISMEEFELVIETQNYFYIKLKIGHHIVIPKAKIEQTDNLRDMLKDICNRYSLAFISELNWKWK